MIDFVKEIVDRETTDKSEDEGRIIFAGLLLHTVQ